MALTATSFTNGKSKGLKYLDSGAISRLNYQAQQAAVYAQQSETHNNGGFIGGIGYLGEKIGLGFLSSVEGIWDYSAGGIAKLFGADDWAERQFDNDWADYNHADEWYNPSDGWRFAGDIAGGIGTSLPAIAGTAAAAGIAYLSGGTLTPVAAGIISASIAGFGAAGNATKEAYRETGNLGGKEFGYGFLSGATEAGVEFLSAGMAKGTGRIISSIAKSTAKETAETVVRTGAKTVIKNIVSDFAQEAFEEGLSEILSPVYQRMTYNPDAQNATLQEVGYAALVGGMSGAIMSLGHSTVNTTSDLISGKKAVENGNSDKIINVARQFTETENAYDTGYESFKLVKDIYGQLTESLKTTDGAVKTVKQKMLLGQLNKANTVSVFMPFVERDAISLLYNAEAVSQKYNEFGMSDADGKKLSFTAEQIRSGVDSVLIKKAKTETLTKEEKQKFTRQVRSALTSNSTLATLAVASATGHIAMDTRRFAEAALNGVNLADSSDLNTFAEKASKEQIAAVSSALDISDWSALTIDDFRTKVSEFAASGKISEYAQQSKRIREAMRTPVENTRPVPHVLRRNMSDGVYRFIGENSDVNMAVIKEGEAYHLFDYDSENISRSLTVSEVNNVLRTFWNSNTAQASTVGQFSEKTDLGQQALDIDNMANEKIPEYHTLSEPNKQAIRMTVRQAQAHGISEADTLTVARVAARSGMNIVFDGNRAGEGDANIQGNTIYLNPDAPKENLVTRLLLHEAGHALFRNSGGQNLITEAFKHIAPERSQEVSRKYIDFYKKQGLSMEQYIPIVNEEIAAAYIEDVLGDTDAWAYILSEEPSVSKKILSFFGKAAQDYSGDAKLSAEARRLLRTYKKLFAELSAKNQGNNALELMGRDKKTAADTSYAVQDRRSNVYATDNRIIGIDENVRLSGEESFEISKNIDLENTRFSIRDGKVIIDTDQEIFDGVDRKDYGRTVRTYMRLHFRGKEIVGTTFAKTSESEYTSSNYTKKLLRQKQGIYEAKMRASTELDNMLRVSEYIGHENAKHPHDYNGKGFDRYSVQFEIGGESFSGELLVAIDGNGRRTFYDVVKIKRTDSPVSSDAAGKTGGKAERGTIGSEAEKTYTVCNRGDNSASDNSITRKSENVKPSGKENFGISKNIDLENTRFSIRDGKVIIDTDQEIFDGVDRKDYGRTVRTYMRLHFRGKEISNALFTKRSEQEYTHSGYAQSLYGREDGVYEAKMKATTELDKMVSAGTFLSHEEAKHPHEYNKGGYDRYGIVFNLDGEDLNGEILIAIGEDGRRIFYDIVNIKRGDRTFTEELSAPIETASNNSITDFSENVKPSGEESFEKAAKTFDTDVRYALKYDEAIEQLNSGDMDIRQNTHLKVLEHTPQIYVDKAGAQNREIIMAWDTAYLAMKKDGDISGNYHGLGTDVMKYIPHALDDPLFIVKQKNGRIAAVTKIIVKGKRAVFASIELEAFKTTVQEGATKSNKYNLIVTVTDAKPSYLQNTIFGGEVVYSKNGEDPANFILRLKSLEKALPTYDLTGSSEDSITDFSENVKPSGKESLGSSKNTQATEDIKYSLNDKIYAYSSEEAESIRRDDGNRIASSYDDVLSFISESLNGTEKGRLFLGKIKTTIAQKIKSETDVSAYGKSIVLSSDEIKHIFNHHGNPNAEALRGQEAVTKNNFSYILSAIFEPDSIERSTSSSGVTSLVFRKDTNGKITSVTVVSEKKKALTLKSAWITKKEQHISLPSDVRAPNQTSDNELSLNTVPENSITELSENVNRKNSDESFYKHSPQKMSETAGYAKKDLSQVNPQLYERLRIVNDKSYNSITDTREKVNRENSEKHHALKESRDNSSYFYSKPFEEQIEDYKNGKIYHRDSLVVSGTPDVLRKIGFNALPITINQTHLDYILNGTKDAEHSLGEAFLKKLPEAIANPLAVIASHTENAEHRLVVILKCDVDGKHIVAPVEIDGYAFLNNIRIDSNAVVSVYGKNTALKQLNAAIKDEINGKTSLYYWNKKEVRTLMQRAGLQLPGRLHQDDLTNSVSQNGGIVNRKISEKGEILSTNDDISTAGNKKEVRTLMQRAGLRLPGALRQGDLTNSVSQNGGIVNRKLSEKSEILSTNDDISTAGNKKEVRTLMQRAGHRLPGGLPQDGLVHSIHENQSPVNGKFKNVTETQQFKRWFGDWKQRPKGASKVVNADGEPMLMYIADAGQGMYVGSQEQARLYAHPERLRFASLSAAQGMPSENAYYLNMRNPLDTRKAGIRKIVMKEMGIDGGGQSFIADTGLPYAKYSDRLIDIADKHGYDGLILDEPGLSGSKDRISYVVFSSSQIKSADNLGTFDKANPDVRYSLPDTDTDETRGKSAYSYNALTKKADLSVVALPEEVPLTEDGRIDRKAISARGRINARSKNNPNNTKAETYVYVPDIGIDVLIRRYGIEHGLSRNDSNTALAAMKIGDLLENSIAVNELNGRTGNKSATKMSYVLLAVGQNKKGPYIVRTVVDKTTNEILGVDSYGLYAMKAKKEGALFMPKGNEAVSDNRSYPYLRSTVSIADLLEDVKRNNLASEIFSEDVAEKLGVSRADGTLSSDVRYSLPESDTDNNGTQDKHEYSYDKLIQKPDMRVTTLLESVPVKDGKTDRSAVILRGKLNARAQNNIYNNEKEIFVHVPDINTDVRVSRAGIEHGLSRGDENTALASMNIGNLLSNSIAVNELNGRSTKKKTTEMSYVLLAVGQNKKDSYLVRLIVDKNTNSLSEISAYGLYAIKAKKEGALFMPKGNERVEGNSSVSYLRSTISISDLLDNVKGLPLANEIFSEDVLKKLNVSRAEGTLSSDVRYALPDTDVDSDGTPRGKITTDMTDDERYEILKDKNIKISAKTDRTKLEYVMKKLNITESDLDLSKYGDKKRLFKKLGEEFEVFKHYNNPDTRVTFSLSKGGMSESVSKQRKGYMNLAKLLTCLDSVIDNAVGIEAHNRNGEGYKADTSLKNVYVLASAFVDGDNIVPVKLEVKEFSDKENTLYVAIALDKIKMTEVRKQGNTDYGVTQGSHSVNISISDLFNKINPSDESFYKYIPQKFFETVKYAKKDEIIKQEVAKDGVARQYSPSSDISISDYSGKINPSDESFYKYIPEKMSEAVSSEYAENAAITGELHELSDGGTRGKSAYSYNALTKKADLSVVALPEEVPLTEDGRMDRKVISARGRINAKSKNNPNNMEGKIFIYVPDIDTDVLIRRDGIEHGLSRNDSNTALAAMKIGDLLSNSIAVNELNGRTTKKRKTGMSYVLLAVGQNKKGSYVVRTVVDKTTNEILGVDSYGLYAMKAKKEGALFMPKGNEAVSDQSRLSPYLRSTVSIADLFEDVKRNNLASEIFSEDVAEKLGVSRAEGTLSSDVRYSLKHPSFSDADIAKNMDTIADMDAVATVDASKLEKTGRKPADIFSEYFNALGNNISSDIFGDIALSKSSVKSEIRHGITAEKIASVEAIPSVINNGKVIFSKTKTGSDVERIIVAAPIKIGETDYYMGVMLQRDTQSQRLYLHNVVTIKNEKAILSSQDDSLTNWSDEDNSRLFITSILQKAINVKLDKQKLSNGNERYGLSDGGTRGKSAYSYNALTKKADLSVVALPEEVPLTEDGRMDKKAVIARGRMNARKQKNSHNTVTDTYVRVDDAGIDVLLSTDGMKHGIARSEDTTLAVMKIGDVLKNSIAVNELNGSNTRQTQMSYILLGACRNGENLYAVRSVVSKLSHDITTLDIHQLSAVKGKKTDTPNPALGVSAVTEQSSLISSGYPTISVSDFLRLVKNISLANEIFSEDVAKTLGVSRAEGTLSSDVRYALPDTDTDGSNSAWNERFDAEAVIARGIPRKVGKSSLTVGELRKVIANNTKEKVYSKKDAMAVVKRLTGASGLTGKTVTEISDVVWQLLNEAPDIEYRRDRAHHTAEFIVAKMMLETRTENPDVYAAEEKLSYLQTGIGKLSFSENDISEIRRIRGDNGLKQVIGRWGYKGSISGNKTLMDTFTLDVAQNMPAMEHLESMRTVDAFLEIDELYEKYKSEAKEKYIFSYRDMSSQEAAGMIESITNDIMKAYETEGEQSKFSRLVDGRIEYYRERADYWKAEHDEIKGAERMMGLIKRKARKIRNTRLVNFSNATQHDSDTFNKIIERFSQIESGGNLNVSKTRAVISDLRKWYTSYSVKTNFFNYINESNTGFYDQRISDMMERLSAGQSKFSKAELKSLYDVMSFFDNFVENRGKVFRNGKLIEAKPEAERYIKLIRENQALKSGALGKIAGTRYMQTFGDPMSVARCMDMYKSGFYTEMMTDLRNASIDAKVREMELHSEYDEFMGKHKRYVEKASAETVTYLNTQIPKMHLISLYMTLKRKHAQAGLAVNGFAFIGNDKKRISVNGTVNSDAMITVSEAEQYASKQLSVIEELLTDTDREYAAILEKVYNVYAREMKINRDKQRTGITSVTEDYYYPIRRSVEAKGAEAVSDVNRLSSHSFEKNTVMGAMQELFIESADTVFNRYIEELCQYVYISPAVETYNRLFNLNISENNNKPVNVFSESANTWANGNKYFTKLISDIQGIPAATGAGMKVIGKIRNNYAKFQLGANPKVLLSQMTSLISSTSILDTDCIIRGFVINAKEVDKYCSLAKLRNYDNTAAMSQGVLDSGVKRAAGGINKLSNSLMEPIGKVDRFVVCRLFGACRVQIAKDGIAEFNTEENKVAAGKLLSRVILETQQNSISTERSAAMRSGNEIMRTLPMFTADNMKVTGRVIDAVGELTVLKARLKAATDPDVRVQIKDKIKRLAYRNTRKALGAAVTSALFMALLTQGFRWLYNKERDEDEDMTKTVLIDTVGNMIGALPLFKDVYARIFDGYDIDNYAYSTVNDLLKSTQNMFEAAGNIATGNNEPQDLNRAARSMAYSVGQILGIPVRNVYNVFHGATSRFSPEAAYSIDSAFYKKNYREELSRAIENGDEEKISFIMSLLLGERGEDMDEGVFRELVTLAKSGQKINPKNIPSSISVNGEKYNISSAEREAIGEIYSQSQKALKSLFSKSRYSKLSDVQKADAVDYIYNSYYNKALNDVLGIGVKSKSLVVSDIVGADSMALLYASTKGLASDTDVYGSTVVGSKRKKVIAAINSLNIGVEKKLLLICSRGYTLKDNDIRGLSAEKAKKYLLHYILSLRGRTKEEKAEIARMCGFEVKNGRIVTKTYVKQYKLRLKAV